MELIHLSSFCMTNSLCLLLILSHQIRRWRQFGKHIIDGINLPHHLQQEEKSGKRKIARCSILKLMDGGQTKPCKFGNLFLGEIASHSIFLESYSQKRTNSGVEYSYKSAIIFYLFIYHYNDIYPLYQPLSSIY